METTTYSLDIRDTATHDIPDTDGDDAAVERDNGNGHPTREAKRMLVKVVNTLDQSADVTLKGSTGDDAAMDEDVDNDTATSSVTVAAGASTVLVTTDPWSYLRLTASCGTAPASGSLKVVYQHSEV